MQALNRREHDIDVVLIRSLKILHLAHHHALVAKTHALSKQILARLRIQEIVAGFVDDIRAVHEEQKIAEALLIQIQNQACHHQRLAASCCHVEQQLVILARFAVKSLLQ